MKQCKWCCAKNADKRETWWHGILFKEPKPTGSRPSDLIGLEEQHMKPHPPNTQGRARKNRGDRGHPEEAESHPEEAERRRKDRKREGGEGGGDQGSPEGRAVSKTPRGDTNGVGVEAQTKVWSQV